MLRSIFLLFLIVLGGCNQKPSVPKNKQSQSSDSFNNEFLDLNKTVVSQVPPVLSVASTIDLGFNTAVIASHQTGFVLDKSPFVFEPAVEGSAKWLSVNMIRFTPTRHLKPGVSYKVVFKGKTAFGERRNVNDYEFTFKTAEQEVLSFNADFVPAETGKNMVRLSGSVSFAQPVDIGRLKKDLKCKKDRKQIDLELSVKTDDPRTVNISMAPLQRGAEPVLLTFTLPQSYKADQGEWQKEIVLPEAFIFKVITHMDMGAPQGDKIVYGFRFSDPVKSDLDLSGFVSIEPQLDFTVSVDDKYLKIKAPFVYGNDYQIRLSKGLPSAMGTVLSEDYLATVTFNNMKPKVEWLSKGVFLPSDNQYKIQLKTVNIKDLNITVTEIYNNNIGFFLQNNILHDEKNNRPAWECYECDGEYGSNSEYYDLERVGKEIYSQNFSVTDMKNKWVTTEIDLSKAFSGKSNSVFVVVCKFNNSNLCGKCINDRNEIDDNSLYYSSEENYYQNPCSEGYYYRNGTVSKLLIASDIALTLKTARDGLHVYAVNALKAQPVSGLTLSKYSYLNQVMEKVVTDKDGHARFSNSEGQYIRGEEKGNLAIIRLNHPAWELSSYDISGVDEKQTGIDMFMYADRGVHRPGDTIHLSAIIRADRNLLPEDQMAYLKVTNPLEQTVFEGKQKCGKNGHLYFKIPTDIKDPTGNYVAEIKAADERETQILKVETVKPNRLKVNIDIADTVTDAEGRVSGTIESRYLFGTPASGLRAVVHATCSAQPFSTPIYSDYTFGHPLRKFSQRRIEVIDTELDEDGKVNIGHNLENFENVPELLNVKYQATVYEKGGGFTAQTKNVIASPYSAYVGIKNSFNYSSAQTGQTYKLPVIILNTKGKILPGRKLTVRWYVNKYYWWYDYDSRNNRDFRTSENTYKIDEFEIVSDDKPVIQELEIDDEGQHFIEVIDEQGGHSAGMFFWASSWGEQAPTQKAQKPLLSISSDKNVYYTGDNAVLSCETPDEGLAIFTMEQGSRILYQEIKKVNSGKTDFKVKITDEFVPNCYATVSLIQPANRNKNDLPLRIYGIKTLMVEDATTRLRLSLNAPDELKANEKFDLKITSDDSREASFTVAVVDEGLLDLTGFKTPDAWNHYFQKKRLGVISSDNFEEILSSLIPGADKVLSIGGDQLADQSKMRSGESRVQRFKPVVLYSAPIVLKPGNTSVISFTMPNYVGSVRVMVVGCAQHSYTSLEKTIPVKQPLMVLTTVPRVARPGDLFKVPVSVFAMENEIRDAIVKIKVSKNLSIKGIGDTTLTFEKPGEQDVAFSVRVNDEIGKGTIIVSSTSGKHITSDTTVLPLTSPNPYYIKVTDTVFTDKELVLVPKRIGIKGTNKARITISKFPDIQIDKRLMYLIRYPHGCIEQTTSSVFPQLYIGKLLDLKQYQNLNVTDNINAGINRLQSFRVKGGFSYWPTSSYNKEEVSTWGSNYAGHFLIEAKRAGYHVPEDLFNHWIKYANDNVRKIGNNDYRYQTYLLYLLSLAGKPNTGAMNLVRENHLDKLDPLSKKFLAGAYYMAGQKDAAKVVDKHMGAGIKKYRETGDTYGSSLRDRCIVAIIAYNMGDINTSVQLMRSIAKEFIPNGWYSTQETAFALMAICAIYSDQQNIGDTKTFTMKIKGGKTEKMELRGYQMSMDVSEYFDKEISFKNDNKDPLCISLYEEGIPLEDIIVTEQQGIFLQRTFYNENGEQIELNDIMQGDQFWIHYNVNSVHGEELNEVALSSLFPSGWEIINPRMEGLKPPQWVSNLEPTDGKYMDIRDDRVNWFFDLNSSGSANFMIKCSATFTGKFHYPPVTVETMYSPDYYARIASDTVTIDK